MLNHDHRKKLGVFEGALLLGEHDRNLCRIPLMSHARQRVLYVDNCLRGEHRPVVPFMRRTTWGRSVYGRTISATRPMCGDVMPESPHRFLCISSYEKGQDFLRQCAELGVRPTLLTVEKLRNADWPREAIEDVATVPDEASREQILNTVSWMARGRRFDRVVALDEFDQEIAALIREHMRLPGMNFSTASCYRDKLAMRTTAGRMGFLVPEFCGIFNYDDLRAYMAHVSPP